MSETIGKKLRNLRKAKKLTQEQAAAKIGIKRSTISNYEIDRRQPSLTDLEQLAAFYGVGLDYFGIASTDEIFEILARSRKVFENDTIPEEKKKELFDELMKLYLQIK